MATRVKRVSAPHDTRDVVRDEPRAARNAHKGGKGAARKPVAPALALRIAAPVGSHDATPVHPEPRPSPSSRAAHAPREVTPAPRPRKPNGARKQFTELREALAAGWEIVQPVFARPLWSAADDSLTAFSFVLRRESATRLVTVPGGRLVERFITTRQLKVDERR
jgi:hypothetical protein